MALDKLHWVLTKNQKVAAMIKVIRLAIAGMLLQ